jgi:hypothetical protein
LGNGRSTCCGIQRCIRPSDRRELIALRALRRHSGTLAQATLPEPGSVFEPGSRVSTRRRASERNSRTRFGPICWPTHSGCPRERRMPARSIKRMPEFDYRPFWSFGEAWLPPNPKSEGSDRDRQEQVDERLESEAISRIPTVVSSWCIADHSPRLETPMTPPRRDGVHPGLRPTTFRHRHTDIPLTARGKLHAKKPEQPSQHHTRERTPPRSLFTSRDSRVTREQRLRRPDRVTARYSGRPCGSTASAAARRGSRSRRRGNGDTRGRDGR